MERCRWRVRESDIGADVRSGEIRRGDEMR